MEWTFTACRSSKSSAMTDVPIIESSRFTLEPMPDAPYCLETLSESVRYYGWIYSLMRPYLGSRTIRTGYRYWKSHNFSAPGSPLSNCYRHRSATHRFSSAASAGNASTLHGMRVATGAIYKTTSEGAVRLVISSNVLEHLTAKDEAEIVSASFEVVCPGGYSVHWVPAFQSIFGSLTGCSAITDGIEKHSCEDCLRTRASK